MNIYLTKISWEIQEQQSNYYRNVKKQSISTYRIVKEEDIVVLVP